MDRKRLKEILIKNKVLEDLYSLDGGLPSEAYCIEESKDEWKVYYSERGIKRIIGCFESEEEACGCFLEEIKKVTNII